MQTVIYADILIFVNTVITFLILLTTADIIKIDSLKIRYITGSFVGGIFSLIILAPEMNIFFIILTRIFICFTIVLISFNIKNFRILLKCTLGFTFISFLYAGIVYFLTEQFNFSYIILNNGYSYFDINILTLIIISVIIYFLIKIFAKKVLGKQQNELIFNVRFELMGKKLYVKALYDSGNSVNDVFTGMPVIIVSINQFNDVFDKDVYERLNGIIGGDLNLELPNSMRLIPIRTLGETKMIPAITAKKVSVYNQNINKSIEEICIAICDNCFDNKKYEALINESVLGEII